MDHLHSQLTAYAIFFSFFFRKTGTFSNSRVFIYTRAPLVVTLIIIILKFKNYEHKKSENIRVNISLPKEFYAAIRRKADEQYLKPNTIIKQLLIKSVNDMQKKGQPTEKKFY